MQKCRGLARYLPTFELVASKATVRGSQKASLSDLLIISTDTTAAMAPGLDFSVSTYEAPADTPAHEKPEEIIRQVEYYFSDENLPNDAHLLAKTGGDGNGPVKIGHILSFRKMRSYKPKSAVVEALRQSTLLEITADGKYIKRKSPLTIKPTVTPKLNDDEAEIERREDFLAANPHLTKNMLKATGFERNYKEPSLTPDELTKQKELYDPEEHPIYERIETAIQRWRAKRKLHSATLKVFEKWMIYGGIESGQRQFTGGLTQEELEDMDASDIAKQTANNFVAEEVKDAVDDFAYDPTEEPTWAVDFEGTAKGFLSSELTSLFEDDTDESIKTTCTVMRNFFTYLLHHDVCPEYKEDIASARNMVDQAEPELLALKKAGHLLPGDFNTACSTLHAGTYTKLGVVGSWDSAPLEGQPSGTGWSEDDTRVILMTGLAAYGTVEQLDKADEAISSGFKVVREEALGLEVNAIQHWNEDPDIKAMFEDTSLHNTVARPMGKMSCVRWHVPHAPKYDLPADVVQAMSSDTKIDFIIDQNTLQHCTVGMKLEAIVKELDIGVKWIDLVEATYPSFYSFWPNERIKDWKEPGPPKVWMKRQKHKEDEMDDEDKQLVKAEDDDDMPD